MRKFVYPAVIYYEPDSKVYVLAIEDLGIYVEGDSVEEAHSRGEQFLATFLEQSLKDQEEYELRTPMDFETLVQDNPKNICVLVEATLDDKNKSIHRK